jgi:hypothetical protein
MNDDLEIIWKETVVTWGTIPEFSWRNGAGVSAEISDDYFPKKSEERYRSTNLPGVSCYKVAAARPHCVCVCEQFRGFWNSRKITVIRCIV